MLIHLRLVASLTNVTTASTDYNDLVTSKNIAVIKITTDQPNTPGGGIPKFYLPAKTGALRQELEGLSVSGAAQDTLLMVGVTLKLSDRFTHIFTP